MVAIQLFLKHLSSSTKTFWSYFMMLRYKFDTLLSANLTQNSVWKKLILLATYPQMFSKNLTTVKENRCTSF